MGQSYRQDRHCEIKTLRKNRDSRASKTVCFFDLISVSFHFSLEILVSSRFSSVGMPSRFCLKDLGCDSRFVYLPSYKIFLRVLWFLIKYVPNRLHGFSLLTLSQLEGKKYQAKSFNLLGYCTYVVWLHSTTSSNVPCSQFVSRPCKFVDLCSGAYSGV